MRFFGLVKVFFLMRTNKFFFEYEKKEFFPRNEKKSQEKEDSSREIDENPKKCRGNEKITTEIK